MAPSRTRKQPSRQADYTNIGVAGRKTGITLKDTGLRDEHGLEPIDGIFSSPEKAISATTPQSNGLDRVVVDETDMSMETSTVPDPTAVLSARRTTLPPRSRSPTKTQLGSSPRRSLGPRSSPLYAGHVAATRANITTGSSPIETQPHDATSVEHSQAAKTPEANSRKRKRIFELSTTETEEDEATRDIGTEMDPNPLDNDVTDEPMRDWDMLSNGEQQPDGVAEQSGISRNSRADLIATSEHVNAVESRRGKARGRPKTATANNVNIAEGDENSVAQITTASNRRRGRPRRDAALPQNIGAAETDKENKPSGTNIKIKRSKIGATKAKPSPSERNLNARVTGDTLVRNEGDYSDKGRPKPRSLLMLRSETPAEDNGALLLRSGRTSVKPLAFWRNERIVYDKYSIEGVKLPLPGMKEVIRTEEAPAPERKIKKRGRKSRKLSKVSEDEKDDGQEEWEKEDGVLEASVMDWDSETQRGLEENPVEIQLAFAAKGLDDATREVKNSSFQYGKTVTLPFFHSGVVDLPPKGEKKMKNSRRNHMVFWVFSGRVDVDVSNNQFSIGKGGMWQVPRGNFYNLTNPYDKPARVFFAQGCYMTEQEGLELSE